MPKMIDGEGIHQLGLISDRALAPGEEDRFAHDDFVDQLEALIRSGIDTANIALYGSWGAGKSSISRRLADRFRSGWDKKHFRFVELNAFKYVDTPLLRTFIYRIAEATVPGKLEHYHHQLYEHATKSKLKAPDGWGAVIRVTALLVFGLLAAVATLLLVLPAGSAYHAVLDVLRALAPSTIIVGVLVTAASRVLPNFSAENERLAPASAEQFEQLFRDLVREDLGISGEDDKRLVVFIDELDRCSAGEVARTLETLRTFVNIPGCIFIVAADQQVLEHALTEHVRQSTPADMINPYYSAGSGYLDKIFEYQLSLPALLPSRLVDFAAALVADVGGVWAELDDLDSVLSVLIPVHVRSPRRVKVLLNRFAMTYSVARKRVSAGSLGNDLPQRAPELAKLVCIRTEFPIFAAELERDARIVEVIGLCLLHDEDGDPGTEDNRLGQFELELRHRAKQVVHGEFAVDEILSEDESYDDEQEDALVSRAATATVRRAHAAQLVDYIRQTQAIHGPRQDLVNLESIGASFGADPAFAMDLESAALANQRRRVLDLMTTAEPDERRRGLLVLAALVRRSCGLDARNVMRSLLRACEDTNDPIDDVAPKIARQLEDSGATVGSEEIAGALRVAVLGGSVRLADELMARPELITSPQSRHRALRLSPRLLEGHRKELSSIAAYEAEHEAGTLAAILGGLSDTDATAVIAVAIDEIESVLAKACQEAEQESEQPDESEGSARLSSLLASIGELARALAGHGHKHAAERTLLTLVHLDAHQALALLDELQEELQPIVSETVVRALASDLRHREPASWRELLGKLDRDTLRTVTTVALQDNLASQWWKRWQKAGEDVMPELQPALGAVVELREMKPTGALPKLTEQIHSALAANFTTEDVAILQHLSRGASMLAEANMLEATLAPNLTVSRVGEIAAAELNPTLAAIELSEQLSEILRGTVHAADEEIVVGCAQALGNSPWVEPPWRELMRMFLDAALPPSLRNGAIDAQKLTALRNDYGVPAHAVIAVWLTGVKPEVPEALLVLRPWIAQPAPNEIREAIRDYTAALEPQQLTNLAAALTAGGLKRHPTRELLADVRYGEAEEATIGAAIVKLVDQASNQDTRAVLFELWEALQPVDPSVRKTLISEIMIPVASQGQGAYDLVRSRLKLATDPPHGTKQELVDRLLAAAPDEKRRKQMQSRMEDLGLRKRPGKRFGLIPR
jgi:Cdc6-like AAA superfamily ATPase